jgi:PAB-dependent poly(A)-specific ribonuclease subunit 3
MHQAAFSVVETWSKIKHPSIVSVKEAFTTRAFNDNCTSSISFVMFLRNECVPSALVVAYAYHPNSQTLFDAHFKPKAPTFYQGRLQALPTAIPERTLWSYIVQIAGAVKTVHDAGCAVRMIDVTKVLVTGKNRCDDFRNCTRIAK